MNYEASSFQRSVTRVFRRSLLVAIPVASVVGLTVGAYAAIKGFNPGDPLKSADLNANFVDLDTRLKKVETGGTSSFTVVKAIPSTVVPATFTTFAQITVTLPAAGTVLVTAMGNCVIPSGAATNIQLSTAAIATGNEPFGNAASNGSAVTETFPLSLQGTFPLSAGPQIIYLQGRNSGQSCTFTMSAAYVAIPLTSN